MMTAESGRWQDVSCVIPDGVFDNRMDGADLTLKHLGGDDVIFHMIELDRQ